MTRTRLTFQSVLFSFVTAFQTLDANGATVTAPHPRLWLTPDRVKRVQAAKRGDSVRWRIVKKAADAEVDDPRADYNDIWVLAMAYVGTGSKSYCNKVSSLLQSYATAAQTFSGGNY